MIDDKKARSVDRMLGPIIFGVAILVFIGLSIASDNQAMAIRDTGRFLQFGGIAIIVASIVVGLVRRLRSGKGDTKPTKEDDQDAGW